jgi:SAM-dependent methyltransferase
MYYRPQHLIEIIAKTLKVDEPILELGACQFPWVGRKYVNLRSIFAGKKYISSDLRKGRGVDIVENMEQLSFPDNSIGMIITIDSLEHVQNFILAMDEIYRVLKTNGLLVMTSVMNYPIHDFPIDYWRFTPDGFKYLLRKFNIKIICSHGEPDFPWSIFGIAIKGDQLDNKILTKNLKMIARKYRKIENENFENRKIPLIHIKRSLSSLFFGKHNSINFDLIIGNKKTKI